MPLNKALSLASFGPFQSHPKNSPSKSRCSSITSERSLYIGKSNRPMGWKSRRYTGSSEPTPTSQSMGIKRWDGILRESTDWDGLRRDSELCFPDGDCLIYLYGQGLSRRGPSFQVSLEKLLALNCGPMLEKYMQQPLPESPISINSDTCSAEELKIHPVLRSTKYEIYIPAPDSLERGQEAYLYHTATRNFFAWAFGKPLVGSHLGGALVGLLNSINEFRSIGEDNVQDVMDYMDDQGYADCRNTPDHALAILFFADHFHYHDLWIDAFAHCTGMHERLPSSAGFEFMSRTCRALVTRSRFEMDMRLDHAGRMLGSFLTDELSDAHLGLPPEARTHLDKFRSFLQAYYVAKLGYYPPQCSENGSAAFPKSTYALMYSEFQNLYGFLVDSSITLTDTIPFSQQGGICVLQSLQSFDSRHRYPSLPNPLPLLPDVERIPQIRFSISRWMPSRQDKMKPDPRLLTFSALTKASNCLEPSFTSCSLVRAYRGFEKDTIFHPDRASDSKLSPKEARRVRWILIYSILQTLLSVTRIPPEVRDTHNVPYPLCVQTAGCPTWKADLPASTLFKPQTEEASEDFVTLLAKVSSPCTPAEIKPDVDYFALAHRPKSAPQTRRHTTCLSKPTTRKGTVRKALSTLGNMPELAQPQPKRALFHEILVHGYGNGTNAAVLSSPSSSYSTSSQSSSGKKGRKSIDSASGSGGDISSRWSNSEASSRRCSNESRGEIVKYLDGQVVYSSERSASRGSAYSSSVYSIGEPDPLRIWKGKGKERESEVVGDGWVNGEEERVVWDLKADGQWISYVRGVKR